MLTGSWCFENWKPLMPKTWFRVHAEGPSSIVDNVKIYELSDKLFRWLMLLWACSCRTEGWLPPLKSIAFRLRKTEKVVTETVEELVTKRFIDRFDDGLFIHDWSEHQFNSDSSTERVRKFREQSRNVSETPRAQAHAGGRSESVSVSASVSVSSSGEGVQGKGEEFALVPTEKATRNGWKAEGFDQFWAVVWWKTGKDAARAAWDRKVKSPGMIEIIIQAAKDQGPELLASAQRGQRSAIHPATWLNQGRWSDEAVPIIEVQPQRSPREMSTINAAKRFLEGR